MTTIQVAFRLDQGLVSAMDDEAMRLSLERPGLPVTRADVVRVALTHYLAGRGVRLESTDRGARDDATSRIGASVRAAARARIDAGAITQADIARRSGIDKGQLSRFLAGEGGLASDRLGALASALDTGGAATKSKTRARAK